MSPTLTLKTGKYEESTFGYMAKEQRDAEIVQGEETLEHLECICGECKGNERRHFVCVQCYRITPWCRGANDKIDWIDLCDECAAQLEEKKE